MVVVVEVVVVDVELEVEVEEEVDVDGMLDDVVEVEEEVDEDVEVVEGTVVVGSGVSDCSIVNAGNDSGLDAQSRMVWPPVHCSV